MPATTPYGAWRSPFDSARVIAGSVRLGSIARDGDDLLWLEGRPQEAGRTVLVRRRADGATEDLTPAPFDVRSRVHEYGGGAYTLCGDEVVFTNFADQRLYRLDLRREGATPVAWTDEGQRYADGCFDRMRGRLVCVQEDHMTFNDPVNRVVSLDLAEGGPPIVLAEGNDFYAAPRVSPDGSRVAYVTWNHPDMPWDRTELWVVHFGEFGAPGICERVAGDQPEAALEPCWTAGGELLFATDRDGWWNLYRWRDAQAQPLCARPLEFSAPLWGLGQASFAPLDAGRLACRWCEAGRWRLGLLELEDGALTPIEAPWVEVGDVVAAPRADGAPGGEVLTVVASPTDLPALIRVPVGADGPGAPEVLRRAGELDLGPEAGDVARWISVAEPIAFETSEGDTAHGFFYPPQNPEHDGPPDARPPLVVMSHGGPTAATSAGYRSTIQFWTSRGLAVLDVNYRGSSGYGRAYRERLRGQWGVFDVDDCARGAQHLAAQGRVDAARLAIRGGSAGGYTTLCALTFRDVFRAGASHFGVSDLEALARETHKFESRYLDGLIGPYPERRDLYAERSPVHAADRLSCPVILLQGLEDEVVPPNQAELMVSALRAKGLPVAYVTFADEQHGFRQAVNQRRALEAELYFYARVFGFELADPVEPVEIENL